LGALLMGVPLFHMVTPASLEYRHLLPALPPLLLFAGAGLGAVVQWLKSRGTQRQFAIHPAIILLIALPIAASFSSDAFSTYIKSFRGYGQVCRQLVEQREFDRSVFLISADELGEGMFVSEIALKDKRPNRIVLRASKALATSRWDGSNHESKFKNPQEMMRWLEKIPIGVIVLDSSKSTKAYRPEHEMLVAVVEQFAERWELLGQFSVVRFGREYPQAISVYRLRGHETQTVRGLDVDMKHMLGRTLMLEPSEKHTHHEKSSENAPLESP
jgi:hypothetical protein